MSQLSEIPNLLRYYIVAAAFMYGGAAAVPADAALILTIDNYTTTQLALTISGTFDTTTTGDGPGYLAIKNDWSNNVGVHTELFNIVPTVTTNTITIGGNAPSSTVLNTSPSYQFADSIQFIDESYNIAIPAGTNVAGSIVLSGGPNMFDPNTNNSLQLLSGYDWTTTGGWHRLEANATVIPIPAAAWLFGSGLIGLIGIARRKK